MLTLLCRDIRVFDWISDVQEMSSGINISSWCVVVHIMRKWGLLRGSLVVTRSVTHIILFSVSSSQAPSPAWQLMCLRVHPLWRIVRNIYSANHNLRCIGSFTTCRGRWAADSPPRPPVADIYRLLTPDPLELMLSTNYFLAQSVILLVSIYVSVKVIIWPEYSNAQYCFFVGFHA